jgi:hypothetical protein
VKFESDQTIAIELEKEKKTGGPGPGKKPNTSGLSDNPYGQEEDLKDAPY